MRPTPAPSPTRTAAPAAAGDASFVRWAWEWVKSIGTAFLLFVVIRTFLIAAFTIPSGSMERTLQIGDYLMANRAVFGVPVPFTSLRTPAFSEPEHGDIVVFRPTYNDPVIDVVKRVIGMPGDTVQMRAGVMFLNGRQLDEPYAQHTSPGDAPIPFSGWGGYDWHLDALPAGVDRASYRPTRDNWGPLVVTPGHFFLMGDNRDESLDSRFMGFIPRDVIRGKPMFVYYSFDPMSPAPGPNFLSAVRWGRIGTWLR